MKFIKLEVSNAHENPNVYEFHIGIEEMKLMSGVLRRFVANVPIGEKWLPDCIRAKNMIKALKEFIK